MKNLKRVGLLSAALLPLYWAFGQELPSPPPSSEATLSEQVAAPGQAVVPPANVSPGAAEVIKMASSGVGEEVLIAYVNRSVSPFGLSADTILYLRDLGVSSGVITAMLNRDITLQTQPPGPTSPPP